MKNMKAGRNSSIGIHGLGRGFEDALAHLSTVDEHPGELDEHGEAERAAGRGRQLGPRLPAS
jgi:hypothetical protein